MILGSLILSVITILLMVDCLRFGWCSTLISSFWVFTLFFVLSYPVKYLLIVAYEVEYQAPIKPELEFLNLALILSFSFWLVVYLFRRLPRYLLVKQSIPCKSNFSKPVDKKKPLLVYTILLSIVGASLIAYYQLLESNGFNFSLAFEGNTQNEARFGSGHIFFMYTLYFSALLLALYFVKKKSLVFIFIIASLSILAGFLEMVLLGTRRPLFLIGYALLLFLFISKKNNLYVFLLALFPIMSSILAPIGQVLRYSLSAIISGNGITPISMDFIVVAVGSTFEGVEHLANFLSRLNVWQFIFGVDQGVSWLFNIGLSLIPRLVWESKPPLYGSVAEQYFLYPDMYASGVGQTTLPLGIVVDSMYGFGVIFVLIFALFYAKLFATIDRVLFVRAVNPGFSLLTAATVYISMFNLVRGGTSIFMVVAMLFVIAVPFHFLARAKYCLR